MADLERLARAVIEGEAATVKQLVEQALSEGLAADTILQEGLLKGLGVVGEKFGKQEMFLPEVMMSAKAMQAGLELLRPHLEAGQSGAGLRGKVVLGTVEGDIHDIGKNLVAMMLTANGFQVIDLGVNVKPEDFVLACQEHQPQFVGMSALLNTTMPAMARTITALEAAGLRNGGLQVMVGGAPVTPEFASRIGADIYADDALEAVRLLRKAVGW
ncbi:MAG: corrinoid protein [Clostridia bacterium]|nr:corrinoid protein [Clostridia bacterium]MDH7574011.1 corrinoid protein [Clostridia bacterium]